MQVGSANKTARYPQTNEVLCVGILIDAKRFTAKEPIGHSFQNDVHIIRVQVETPDFLVHYSRKDFMFQQEANICWYDKAFGPVFPGFDQNHKYLHKIYTTLIKTLQLSSFPRTFYGSVL